MTDAKQIEAARVAALADEWTAHYNHLVRASSDYRNNPNDRVRFASQASIYDVCAEALRALLSDPASEESLPDAAKEAGE